MLEFGPRWFLVFYLIPASLVAGELDAYREHLVYQLPGFLCLCRVIKR
jgi:hypothetical protein